MLNKIDFKSRTLFSTLKKHMSSTIASKFTLYSACTENTHIKRVDFKSRIHFGTLRKRICHIYIYIYIYIYDWLAIGTHRKLTCRMKLTSELVLYSARTENAYVEWDWLQHSYSIRHSQKAHVKWDWLQVSCSIRHRHKMHMYSKATTSLVLCSVRIENSHAEWDWLQHTLYSARTELHMSSKIECKSRTLFDTHRKRTCRVRLSTTLVPYSARTCK